MNKLFKKILNLASSKSSKDKRKIERRQQRELIEWEARGKPAPPPHIVKQRAIKRYAQKFNLKVLVETGTYLGDMVAAMKDDFDHVYSIELSEELYAKAQQRFAGQRKITLILGDSGAELGRLVANLKQPALFWLDGHYSGGITAQGGKDTPIYEELAHIFSSKESHVILIDDARLFGTEPAYPTIEALSAFILMHKPDAKIVVEDDGISITPGPQEGQGARSGRHHQPSTHPKHWSR